MQRADGGQRQLAVAGPRGESLGGRKEQRDAASPAVEVVIHGLQLVALRLDQVLRRDPRRATVLSPDGTRPDRLRHLERRSDERFVEGGPADVSSFLRGRHRARGCGLACQVGVHRAFDKRYLLLEVVVIEPLEHAQDEVEARLLKAPFDLLAG